MTKTKPKFKSSLEEKVADILGDEWEYEPTSHTYTITREYTPDFVQDNKWIEVKGFFREGDTHKYKSIREAYPDIHMTFVFHAPDKRVRKRNKITMAEWASKNGWDWISVKDLDDNINN